MKRSVQAFYFRFVELWPRQSQKLDFSTKTVHEKITFLRSLGLEFYFEIREYVLYLNNVSYEFLLYNSALYNLIYKRKEQNVVGLGFIIKLLAYRNIFKQNKYVLMRQLCNNINVQQNEIYLDIFDEVL